MNSIELEEWHKIGNKLTNYFGICSCQRKIKSIIDNLYSIYTKCNYEDPNRDFTGAEWLVIAMIDRYSKEEITHGVNCEYPIINENSEFWKWIIEVKNNPYLTDN